jgi:hypothetical protein
MMAETNSDEREFVESSAQVGFKERGLDKVKQVANKVATLRNKNVAKDQHYTSVPDADEDGASCKYFRFCSLFCFNYSILS